jgi:carbon-monoxide dehydrogenase medium subunit
VGDYATAAAAVRPHDGRLATVASCASIGLTNVADTPLWASEAANLLVGTSLDKASVDAAVAAAEAITEPASDMDVDLPNTERKWRAS